jgi:hypothetical protein
MITEQPEIIPGGSVPGCEWRGGLAGAAAAGAQALDLASLGRRHVVRAAPHLAHEPLLLHFAPELPEGLLELLGILDYDSHNPERIPETGPADLADGGFRLAQASGVQGGQEQVAAHGEQRQQADE